MLFPTTQNNQKPFRGFYYGYVIVIATFLITFVIFGVQYAFGVFFIPMMTEFGWTRALTSGAVSLSWIVQGIVGLGMGVLNDKLGPRIVLTLVGLILGVSYLLMSQIDSVWQFYILSGVLVGAGLGGIVVPLGSTLARWFTKRRNFMTGLGFIGVNIGFLVGTPISERIIGSYDWRMAYLWLGAVVLVVVTVVAQFLKRNPIRTGDGNPITSERNSNIGNMEKGISLREALRFKQFWFLFCMLFCFGFMNVAILVHIVPHAIDLGISSSVAAGILATIGGGMTLGIFILTNLADRIGNIKVYTIAFVIALLSAVVLLVSKDVVWLYIFAIIFSFANGGLAATESPLVASLFGLRWHGVIFGLVINGFTIGATLGSLVTGYLFDISGSYQSAFVILAILILISVILSVITKPIKEPQINNSFQSIK
jgi:MFS family permease